MIFNYNRVSSKDQNLDRQIEAFKEWLLKENLSNENYKMFNDKQSGKDFERKNYQEMISQLQEGDLLVIKSLDRLGRNYDLIIEEWTRITKNIKADIVVLDMQLLDTRDKKSSLIGKFLSDIVLQVLSFVAENERKNIKERQAEGIKIAKEKGIKFGAKPKITDENVEKEFIFDYINGMLYSEMQEKYNLSKPSVIQMANRLGLEPRNKRNK